MSKCAEQVERGACVVGFEALGRHHLKDVAGSDELFGLSDHGFVFRLGRVGERRRKGGRRDRCDRLKGFDGEGLLEFFDDGLNLCFSPGVSCLESGMFVGMHVSYQGEAAGAMIEDQDDIRDKENHIGEAEMVRGRFRKSGFEVSNHVVGQITDRAATKNRKGGGTVRTVGAHELFEGGEWVASDSQTALPSPLIDFDVPPVGGNNSAGRGAEEGVTARVLGQLGGFEEETAMAVADFLVGGEWGFVVGG